MLDLVSHDGAGPAFPAVYCEDHAVLSYGELAGLAGQASRVLGHDTKALVLCAGDRDLPTLVAYLAALRLGHAVAFLPASPEVLSAYQPEFVVPAPGAGLAGPGYRPAAGPVAGTTVFRRAGPAEGEIYDGLALLLGTSGSTGSPKTVRLSYSGLAGNTAAVIAALGITAAERGPTTLPGRLGSVGTAVPGGAITIGAAPVRAGAVPGEGAVRYRGPGVMLGYAARRADLRRGAEVDVLDTANWHGRPL